METLKESIYDHPKYYDLVFGSDCAAEIKFILACADKFMKRSATRFFEPACGTGRLIYSLAKKGFSVGGNDLNEKAIEFCNARLNRHGFDDRAFVGDMSDFKVKTKFDVAFNTINSFRHLDSESTARNHLVCMGNAIKKGGLYLLGIHLTPTAANTTDTESWSARRGHLVVNTHMWTKSRDFKNRVERFGIQFEIYNPTRFFRIEDELVMRSYTDKQMAALIESSNCWEVEEAFDFRYNLNEPIEVDDTVEDVVYVLRRV